MTFQQIIDQDLKDRTVPFTRTDGGLAGNDAPISPEDFKALLEAELKWIRADSFDVGSDPDVAVAIAVADYKYNHWANWVNKPLAGDANPGLVEWQKQARATAIGAPTPASQIALDKRVTLLERSVAALAKGAKA